VVLYSVPESERGLRERLRKKLSWHGFGPLAPSVWLSPHDRVRPLRADLADLPPIRLDVFRSRSEGRACDRDMAARAWDLDGLNRDYAALLAAYRPRLERYRRGEPRGRDALLERMRLVQDYRKFPFRDPDLPAELLPEGWLGLAAHDVFLEAHELLRPAAQAWVDGLLIGEGSGALAAREVP
jgi:phenylacetic acid degradation operon negative regulatory protein